MLNLKLYFTTKPNGRLCYFIPLSSLMSCFQIQDQLGFKNWLWIFWRGFVWKLAFNGKWGRNCCISQALISVIIFIIVHPAASIIGRAFIIKTSACDAYRSKRTNQIRGTINLNRFLKGNYRIFYTHTHTPYQQLNLCFSLIPHEFQKCATLTISKAFHRGKLNLYGNYFSSTSLPYKFKQIIKTSMDC